MKVNRCIKRHHCLFVVSLSVKLKHLDYKFRHILYLKVKHHWFLYLVLLLIRLFKLNKDFISNGLIELRGHYLLQV
jgi:hypothetical protein